MLSMMAMMINLPQETLSQPLDPYCLVRAQEPAKTVSIVPVAKHSSRTSLASSNLPTEARYRGESGRNLIPASKSNAGKH